MGISDSHKRVLDDLEKDELIVWRGKPKQGFQFVSKDYVLFPVTILFLFVGIFIIFFEYNKFLCMIPFLGFIYYMYIRYIQGIIERKSTEYYITSKKIVIDKPQKLVEIKYLDMWNFEYEKQPFSKKYGSIIFGEKEGLLVEASWFSTRKKLNFNYDEESFFLIENYYEVYELINKYREKAFDNVHKK